MNHLQVEALARQGRYAEAYQLAKALLNQQAGDFDVLEGVRMAISGLRKECSQMASNKATEFSQELRDKEALLQKFELLLGGRPRIILP